MDVSGATEMLIFNLSLGQNIGLESQNEDFIYNVQFTDAAILSQLLTLE